MQELIALTFDIVILIKKHSTDYLTIKKRVIVWLEHFEHFANGISLLALWFFLQTLLATKLCYTCSI